MVILKMEEMYFSKKLENILLLTNKKFSFDKKLEGDFSLKNNLIKGKKIYLIIFNINIYEHDCLCIYQS